MQHFYWHVNWFLFEIYFYFFHIPQFKLSTRPGKSRSFKLHISGVTGPGSAGLNLSRLLCWGYSADRYDLHVSACGVNTERYVTAGTIRYWRQASSIKDSPTLEKRNRETAFLLHTYFFLSSVQRYGRSWTLLLASFFVCLLLLFFWPQGDSWLGWNTKSVQLLFQLLRVYLYDGDCCPHS